MDRHVLLPAAHASADGGDALRGQSIGQLLAANAVCRQPIVIDDDGNPLLHVPQNAHIRDGRQCPQAVAYQVAILFQLPVIPADAFYGDKQRGRVAELVIYHHIRHTLRQSALERVQPMLDLAPYFILVVHVVIQLHHDAANPVLARAGGFRTLHLLEGEQVAFERPYELLFHLFAGGPRIDTYHDTRPQGEIGKLRFRHFIQSINSQDKHQPHDQKGEAVVAHHPRHPPAVLFLAHSADTLLPLLNFCIPFTMTLSPACKPSVTTIRPP